MFTSTKIDFPKLNQFLDIFHVLLLIDSNTDPIIKGQQVRAFCPIHKGDSQRSLAINLNDKSFFCHSCSAKGRDLISLYAQSKNISQYEAAEYLQSSFSIDLSTMPSNNSQEYNSRDKTIKETALLLASWEKAQELNEHPYFTKKEVKACSGLKFGSDEKGNPAILVPFTNIAGKITAIEYINEHIKLFATGSKRSGSFFVINNEDYTQAKKAYITEGIATALTVYEATKNESHRIVVSCGPVDNMLSVIETIKSHNNNLAIVACPDNDKSGKNVARKILQKNFANLHICMPNFDGLKKEDKHTDFNDLQILAGIEIVKQQLQNNAPQIQSAMIKPAVETESFEQPALSQDNIEYDIQTADQLIDDQDARRMLYQGKEFIGIPQRTLPTLDERLSGLRKFIVLAAAPNVGKTAFAIQLSIDAIQNNNNTCAIFVSLEMSRNDIMDRIRCYLSSMTWKNLYFGKSNDNGDGFYTFTEQKQLAESKEILKTIGNRILILDDKCCKNISALTIKTKIDLLKKKSGHDKAIVVIDYLQVFPVSETDLSKLRTENDIDRYRISQIIMLRDILRNDPLIVIAEARKPSGGEKAWGVSMADILGSSRTAYACDAGILLNTISDDELSKELGINKDECQKIRDLLSQQGLSIVKLTIDKARDGMQKGNILLMFHFLQNKFEEVTWVDIKTRINLPSQPAHQAPQTDHKRKLSGKAIPTKNDSLFTRS